MGPQFTIAHYRIGSKLGEGGMGAVYRATDTKLGREVAVKLLPESFARDPDRLTRFTREAQLLASLNHANIATIYGVEERALVMELVEGVTLAERIAQGPMSLEEALPAARQIAEAVEYAHERGVIHRDLKPANIKITPEGRIKVLDFGLAKAFGAGAAVRDPELSPTITMSATVAGVIMGTAAYMSPEQAKGKPVDRRADIWAFGVILVELLTGGRLYEGETVSETLAAVLLKEPDLSRLPKATPAGIHSLIRRCLDRDPLRRLRDIGEARVILEQPDSAHADSTTPARRWPWIAVALLAGALALVFYFRPADEPRVIRFALVPPKDVSFDVFTSIPAISPDGRKVAVAATGGGKQAIWLRDVESLTGRWLPGTEGGSYPFWSPDSRSLAFFAGGALKKVEIAGELAVKICDVPGSAGGSWSPAGVIIFARRYSSPIMRVPEEGGIPQPVTPQIRGSMAGQRFPSFLPDGRHFLYFSLENEIDKSGIYLAALDSDERRLLLPIRSNAVYAHPGYLLYSRDGTLMAQPFDARHTRITGPAVAIADGIDSPQDSARQGAFSVSNNGVMVYSAGSEIGPTRLTWFDRSGAPKGTLGPAVAMQWPAISRDGKAVVVDQQDPGTGSQDLWLYDFSRALPFRFTFDSALSRYAVWSPNGSHIAFVSNRDGFFKIYRKAVNGSSPPEILHTTPPAWPDDWSNDGRLLIIEVPSSANNGSRDLWVLPLTGDRKAFPYLQTKASERWGRLSPDGRWLAYSSDETGRVEVYVTTFPNPGGKWQVSTDGGDVPVWGRDGKNLFFLAPDRKMMAVDVNGGERFAAGAIKPLFDTHIVSGPQARFDVGPDGRFLVPVQSQQTAGTPLTAVINWNVGIKK